MVCDFNVVGIDKMKLKRFPIRIIDIDKLYNKGNVSISESDIYKREFITNKGIRRLGSVVINDLMFKLIIGIRKTITPYQVIEINPASILYGANIRNISCSNDLKLAIDIIQKRLLEYGLDVDLSRSIIDEIEINNNLKLKESFKKYRNILELIKSCLPKRLNKGGSYEERDREQYTGFIVKNTQISLKFYDKLVERDIQCNYSILRIEYRFLKDIKFYNEFGYDTIQDILDNFSDIKEVYNRCIQRDIIINVRKRLRELEKINTIKLIESQQREYHYINDFLATTQDEIIFDYEIAEKAINKLNIDRTNKFRRKKELKRQLERREKKGSNLFFNNISRFNELVENLGFKQ